VTENRAIIDAALIARALGRSSATLHEAAGKMGALPAMIKPHALNVRVCGTAYPVRSPAGDNLWLHHAIYAAAAGDVLVIDVGSGPEFGYWGEVMAVAAQARGIAGIVINGGARDAERMLALRFPVFSMTPSIRGTVKSLDGEGSLGAPVTIGSVTVNRGDLVFGDCDGVVVLPRAAAAQIVAAGELRDREEEDIFRRLLAGETTMQIYGLPIPTRLRSFG
jgi:4-hydroxy-4-methyl-2-oxoglutarate aldolase